LLVGALVASPVLAQNLLHIRVIEGEGSILGLGARASKGIVVEITDETGRPVESAAVSFRMPEEGPGAVFSGGMRTEIRTTTPDGRAAIHEYVASRLAGPYQVRVTAVKNGVRAGTLVGQYVSEAPVQSKSVGRGSSKKWLAVIAIAGGAAAGGVIASNGRRAATPAAVAPPTMPTVGLPSFTIGGP
jgi:hypothetical protein